MMNQLLKIEGWDISAMVMPDATTAENYIASLDHQHFKGIVSKESMTVDVTPFVEQDTEYLSDLYCLKNSATSVGSWVENTGELKCMTRQVFESKDSCFRRLLYENGIRWANWEIPLDSISDFVDGVHIKETHLIRIWHEVEDSLLPPDSIVVIISNQ